MRVRARACSACVQHVCLCACSRVSECVHAPVNALYAFIHNYNIMLCLYVGLPRVHVPLSVTTKAPACHDDILSRHRCHFLSHPSVLFIKLISTPMIIYYLGRTMTHVCVDSHLEYSMSHLNHRYCLHIDKPSNIFIIRYAHSRV